MPQGYNEFLNSVGKGASNAEILNQFFDAVIESIINDAAEKRQKIPVTSFHYQTSNSGGQLFAADYFKYLVKGRRPGKQPPLDAMLKYVQDNPQRLAAAQQQFKYITEQGLAFLIGRSIAKKGTEIYQGKRPGINFSGAVEDNLSILLEALTMNEVAKIKEQLKSVIK